MPTASKEMISKLDADASAADTALTKLKKYADDFKDRPSQPIIDKLLKQFAAIQPQIIKFKRDADRSPAILCDEGDYKKRRKELTKLIQIIDKTKKAVAKEIASAKKEITVKAVSASESELVISDKKMEQALKAVARGDRGRAGPKEAGIKEYNHIHIGGNARFNLLFQPQTKLVLGTIGFHIESTNSKQQKDRVKKVAGRTGSKITLVIGDDGIRKQ
ncbi:MAG: hypothetical protein BM562_11020 [Alphaproteobacteria bacterium MedPE-SWcel]|nr:MAG: hypothetical protein BM562_11020 [Alphaproteobacteria bacterium MedPE-SWcel]